MARKRFKGSLGKRTKNSPLVVEHLNRALGETTSDREKDIVYANLADLARRATDEEGFIDFYTTLARDEAPLSVSADYRGTPNRDEVANGRTLEEDLREGVYLPQIGHKKEDSKRLQARHDEYATILEYNQENATKRD